MREKKPSRLSEARLAVRNAKRELEYEQDVFIESLPTATRDMSYEGLGDLQSVISRMRSRALRTERNMEVEFNA